MTDEDDPFSDDRDDAPPNAADQDALDKAKRKADRERRALDKFWLDALATRQGRRAVWLFLKDTEMFSNAFAASNLGFPDKAATWFVYGRATFGWRVYHRLARRDPAGVIQMHVENDKRPLDEPF